MIDRDQLQVLVSNFSGQEQAVLSEVALRLAIIKRDHFTGQTTFELTHKASEITDATVTQKERLKLPRKS